MTLLRILSVTCALLVAAAAGTGCGKKTEGGQGTPSKGAAASGPAVRNAAGQLTKGGVDAAWETIFLGTAQATLPIEQKQAALEAKLGAPAKVEKGQKVWFAVDGESCHRVEIGKDGMKGSEKVAATECAR